MGILNIVASAARWTKNIVLTVLLFVILGIIGLSMWFYRVVVPFDGRVGEAVGAGILLILIIVLLSWLAGLIKVALGAKLTETVARH